MGCLSNLIILTLLVNSFSQTDSLLSQTLNIYHQSIVLILEVAVQANQYEKFMLRISQILCSKYTINFAQLLTLLSLKSIFI